jgi:hypothetical protein
MVNSQFFNKYKNLIILLQRFRVCYTSTWLTVIRRNFSSHSCFFIFNFDIFSALVIYSDATTYTISLICYLSTSFIIIWIILTLCSNSIIRLRCYSSSTICFDATTYTISLICCLFTATLTICICYCYCSKKEVIIYYSPLDII